MRRFAKNGLAILFAVALALGSANGQTNKIWFHERITWQADGHSLPWETVVESPNGKERFRLALVPLWSVEGGIVAIQILVARPDHPNDNLLGKRDTDRPVAFVITVEELRRGIKKSQFGATRNFNLDSTKLRVEILAWRLGKGVGECPDCPNIQEFTAILSFGSK
jgi:hypothetical protein